MNDARLDGRSPASSWNPPFIGGHVALDLVNTVSWRSDTSRTRDNLTGPADLLSWLVQAGLMDSAVYDQLEQVHLRRPTQARSAYQDALVLREHAAAFASTVLADSRAHGVTAAPEALRTLLVEALHRSQLTGVPLHWSRPVTAWADVVPRLAIEVLDLLQSPALTRLRRCEGPGCGWLFLDTTRSRTRRYCITADCGNRDRARRHYRRHHGPDGAADLI